MGLSKAYSGVLTTQVKFYFSEKKVGGQSKSDKSLSNLHLNWHVALNENYLGIEQHFRIFRISTEFERIDLIIQESDSLPIFSGASV